MIRGELVDKNDEQTYCESLIENYEREDLSDYEKALFFERMNKEFRRTYEEIGRMVNLSKQQVGSYVAMLRLFSPSQIASNSGLADSIHQLSEHHARILSRVQDREAREDLTLMVVRRHLSVRELTNIVSHLKVWFPKESLEARSEQAVRQSFPLPSESEQDQMEIKRIISDEFRLSHRGDFEKFQNMHLLEDRLSVFFSSPPHDIYQGSRAMTRDLEWFYHNASKSNSKIDGMRIELLGETAVATLRVEYDNQESRHTSQRSIRGTVVLVKRNREWKIFHEHWSEMKPNTTSDSVPSLQIRA